jgi:hypothetical protein
VEVGEMMKWLFRIVAALLVVDLIAVAVSIVVRLECSPTSFNLGDVTPLIVLAGVLIALITLSVNHRRVASEEYLENATDLLSKSYEILDTTKDERGVPKNNRINWLTAARLIRTSESIAELLTEESHKRIWQEKKEYWRGRLRDLIYPNRDGFPQTYFAEKPELMIGWSNDDQEPLSEKSLVVLYRFIQWQIKDPLSNEDKFSDKEIEEMATFGPKQLGQLLKKVREITNKQK